MPTDDKPSPAPQIHVGRHSLGDAGVLGSPPSAPPPATSPPRAFFNPRRHRMTVPAHEVMRTTARPEADPQAPKEPDTETTPISGDTDD